MPHHKNLLAMMAGSTVALLLGFSGASYAADMHKAVIVEGPMPIEAIAFSKKLDDMKSWKSGTFTFYEGYVDKYPVVVVQTGKGMENTAAATAIAITKYDPVAVINQGTSGGHDPQLHVFDIVLGKRTVNIGSFKTEKLKSGIEPTQWQPMDLMASEGSAGEGKDSERIRYYEGDKGLLAAANAVKADYKEGKVVEGTIGSADFWNNELDRIKWLHDTFHTSVEEMEGASAAQITAAYGVPFLDIRILSNNQTNNGKYNPNTAMANQAFVYQVVKKYISTLH
ncbi:5'-methylthioadenosine/S-adenosylhomocysteine nucleosidase [Castellaniella defragrans]